MFSSTFMPSLGLFSTLSSVLPLRDYPVPHLQSQEHTHPGIGLGLGLVLDLIIDCQVEGGATTGNVLSTSSEPQCPPAPLLAQEEFPSSSSRFDCPAAPRLQQHEYPRRFGPPALTMRRSYANIPRDYDSESDDVENDAQLSGGFECPAAPRPPQDEFPLSRPVVLPSLKMRRTVAVRFPMDQDSDSEPDEEELQELEPIMAEPVVGIAISDPKYRQIVSWAVEVERQMKEVDHEVMHKEIVPTTVAYEQLGGGSWWTPARRCLTQ